MHFTCTQFIALEVGKQLVGLDVAHYQVFGLSVLHGRQRNPLIEREKHALVFHRERQ